MLGCLHAAKLNRQNTSTSGCKNKQIDEYPVKQAEKRIPPPTLRYLIKYFDVDDKAADWYMRTRRCIPKVGKKKFCFKFRPPIRHAANRMLGPLLPFYQIRRISPEFLCLLQKHQQKIAKRNPIYQVPGKMLTGKPSFSYYKYKADAKNRHMRPGIDTAAPIEFACKNMACPRRNLTPEQIEKLGLENLCLCGEQAKPIPHDTEPEVTPCCHGLLGSKKKHRKNVHLDPKNKSKSCVDLLMKKNKLLTESDAEKVMKLRPRTLSRWLHLLYDSNPSATQMKYQDSREKLHQIFVPNRNVIVKKPQKKVSHISDKTDFCPASNPKAILGPCCQQMCPNRKAKIKDPRSIEYKTRPYYKILQESDNKRKGSCCGRSKRGSRSNSCVTTEEDDTWESRNWFKSLEKEERKERADNKSTGYRVRPNNSPHRFHDAMAECPHHVLVRRSRRPDIYDQNDVEMPPKQKADKCGYGFTGFIHNSEYKKNDDRCYKGKKPPPYCYYWSAVDPDIRHDEKTRLAEKDYQNRNACITKQPHTYFWSKVPYNKRSEAKKRLAESRESVVEKKKLRAPLFGSKEANTLNKESCAVTKKKSSVRQGSKTSQRSRRSSPSKTDNIENVTPRHYNTFFMGNHSKQYNSFSTKPKKKSRINTASDSSSDCACSKVEGDQYNTELRSSYLSTRPINCQSNESEKKPKMKRKTYTSDRESDKKHMWSGPIITKKSQCLINASDGNRFGFNDSRSRIIKKPRIFPNLQAVFRHFLWPSKCDKNLISDKETRKKSSNCLKTHKDDTGPCVRRPEDSHKNPDRRRQYKKSLGMERIQSPERQSIKAESLRSSYGQTKRPRDSNFWSGRKEKRERSNSSTIMKRGKVNKTGIAPSKSSIRERRRSVTPMSIDTEPECCRKPRRIMKKKCKRSVTYPITVATSCEEEPHRESYSFRNRPIQYRNYTGPEPKLSTRYESQRSPSRSRSPRNPRSCSPKIKRKLSTTTQRKRCCLPKPNSQTSLLSDGYLSPTYSKKEYPCLAAQQNESRAQREWEERREKKKIKRKTSYLADERSNDWLLTSRAADEHRTEKCRRSLILTEESKQFPNEPNYWDMMENTNDMKDNRKRYKFQLVQPSNMDLDSYMEMDEKCGKRPNMLYVKRAEETFSDGDENDELTDECNCADQLKVPQIYDYKTFCPNPQVKQKQKDSLSKKKKHDDYWNYPSDRSKSCSRKSSRIRGGIDFYQREKPHSFASICVASYHNKSLMHYREDLDNKNTNWTHNFCF